MNRRGASVDLDQLRQGLSSRQNGLRAGYLLNRKRGASTLRRMIREDMNRFTEMGARRYASDLGEVLRHFDSKFP
jgi:hypothetical protein